MKIGKRMVFWAILLLAFVLAGCGGKEQETPETAENEDGKDYIYVAEYQTLEEDGYIVGDTLLGQDNTVFFLAGKDGEMKLFSQKLDGGKVEIPLELEENTYVAAMGNDKDGNLLLGLIRYSGSMDSAESVPEDVIMRKIKEDGTLLEDVTMGKALLKAPEFYIQDLIEDKEGYFYVCTGQKVFVLKPNGELYFEVDAGSYISNMFCIKGEKTVIAMYGDINWEMQEIDLIGKGLKALDAPAIFDYGTYQSGGEAADILYTVGTKLYSYNLGEDEPVEILNWVDSDIDSDNLRKFAVLADGRVVAVSVDWNSAESGTELAVLTKKDRSEVPEKIILTYGTTYLPYFVKTDVVAFNQQSDKYRIEIKEYGEGDKDYETTVGLWTADMSSGNGPDIIDMVYCPVSLQELEAMGVLEDLNPYLDGDAEINREDYIESAMKAYELNGKLYAIMRCFGVSTVIGKTSDVGEGDSWTLDDVFALVEAHDKDVELFEYTTKYNALQMMLQANGEMFIGEDGTCNFEDGEFIKILEFANRFPKEVQYDPNAPSDVEKIRNGKLLLLKETVTSGGTGMMITPNGTTAAMNANSKNKEGVWEFFRFLMTKERQENLQSANAGFPIMRSALEKQFEEDMQAEYYEDVDGTKKEKPKATWTSGMSGEITVDVYAATQEQVDRVRQMIDAAGVDQIDSQMLEIIMEEAQSYFDGQKSAEDVAALIQNRMQVYVNEKR